MSWEGFPGLARRPPSRVGAAGGVTFILEDRREAGRPTWPESPDVHRCCPKRPELAGVFSTALLGASGLCGCGS